MSRYETQTPRMAIGVAAIAMTALTIALAVVAPARLDWHADQAVLAGAKSGALAAIEVAIVPSRIEVIGVRDPDLATDQVRGVKAASHFHVIQMMGKPQT